MATLKLFHGEKLQRGFRLRINLLSSTVNNCTSQSTMKRTQMAEVSKRVLPQAFLQKEKDRPFRYFSYQNDRSNLVRVTGLEPAREYHWNLNPACLPIPPYPHVNCILAQPFPAVKQNEPSPKETVRCWIKLSRRQPAGSRQRWRSR